MPTVDFGSVTLSVDEGRVDAFFPFEHGEVKDALKRLNGRWNPDRRCWIVMPRFARTDEDGIVRAVEEALYANAPRKWPEAVERYGAYACATKRYEVKFGAGGIRLVLPAGHPCHWTMEQMNGASRKGDTWVIPARDAKTRKIMPVIERVAREDRNAFVDAVEPYEGRTLKGSVPLAPADADAFGLVPGRVVFAEHAFLKEADPLVVNMPVHAWPFKVVAREDVPGQGWEHLEGGIGLKLAYLGSAHGYKAVRRLQAMPEERRPAKLDAPHAGGKWHARRG